MSFLKQPLIIAYILTGILISPQFLNIPAIETISMLGQVGIAILLFMVGLSLNPKVLKDLGIVSLATGIGQILFTTFFGFLICLILGFSNLYAIYIAVGIAFSSTIIITKLLSDKGELDTLYGKIAIGFLIVQDLVAMFTLMIISSVSSNAGIIPILFTVLKGIILLVILFFTSIYLLPKFTEFVAKSQEFLMIFALGWCLIIAGLFHFVGFSMEIGALVAGLLLSMSKFEQEINFRLKPIKDFFIVLFFVTLGSQMQFGQISGMMFKIIILSILILIGNPIIVMAILGIMGYTKKTSFNCGLAVAQISEFSLILITLGVKVGHLTTEVQSLMTIIAIITIGACTYMVSYSNFIYQKISKFLTIFERKDKINNKSEYNPEIEYDAILFGYNRIGFDILDVMKKKKTKFLVVDFNPDIIKKLSTSGVDYVYGDAGDIEFIDELNLSKVKMIISTVPDEETNTLIIKRTKIVNENAIIIVVSHQIDESLRLYEQGASYVVLPHFLGGHHAAMMIQEMGFDTKSFFKEKVTHINELIEKKRLGFDHPRHEKTEKK